MKKETQAALMEQFEVGLEAAQAKVKSDILSLAAAYNRAVDGGEDATALHAQMNDSPHLRIALDLLDANDPEVASALRDLGLTQTS
jgi:hypothetical protein